MAKRERQTKDLRCNTCGKEGTLAWTENENPMHAGGMIDPQVSTLSKGFILGPDSRRDSLPPVECGDCGTSVG